ncbi:hypothetical protein [Nocardiopsis tropica]|uniref:hypothetical protein n=1 Tax=Nocardiopsis tropica TaxID=109330 RepID=UPI0031DD77A1
MTQRTATLPRVEEPGTARAASVLAYLVTVHPGLPALHWSVTRAGALRGHCAENGVSARIREVSAWSAALEVPVTVEVAHTGEHATASASTVVDGVDVEVYALVYRTRGEAPSQLGSRVRSLVTLAGGAL